MVDKVADHERTRCCWGITHKVKGGGHPFKMTYSRVTAEFLCEQLWSAPKIWYGFTCSGSIISAILWWCLVLTEVSQSHSLRQAVFKGWFETCRTRGNDSDWEPTRNSCSHGGELICTVEDFLYFKKDLGVVRETRGSDLAALLRYIAEDTWECPECKEVQPHHLEIRHALQQGK